MALRESSKILFKEIIEFYESCGRNKNKTMWHFVNTKQERKERIYRLIKKYDQEGRAVLEKTPKRKTHPKVLEMSDRVLQLLKQDPSISLREGGQILGVSSITFLRYKTMLLNPKKLTCGSGDGNKLHRNDNVEGKRPAPEPEVNLRLELDDLGHGEDDSCEPETPVATTPAPAPLKVRKKSFRHCLVCYNRLDSQKERTKKVSPSRSRRGTLSGPSTPNEKDDNSEFTENLNVIFALKNIFGLNSSDLVRFMEISKGKNPKGWYHLCSECDEIMKEAVAIQQKVFQLTMDLEKCKSRMQEKVKESCRASRKLKAGEHEDDVPVTKLIRESICPQKKRKTKVKESGGPERLPVQVEDEESNQGGLPSGFEDSETTQNETVEVGPLTNAPSTNEETIANAGNTKSLPEIGKESIDNNTNGTNLKDLQAKPKLAVCDLCGKEMRLFSLPLHTLRVHDVLMDGYTEFKCSEDGCQFKAIYKDSLIDHKRKVHVALNQRKWACQFCGKKFKCREHLRDHELIHKNAQTRPYQCEICGQGFAVFPNLWCHIKGVHEGRVGPYRKRLLAQKKGSITPCNNESSNQNQHDGNIETTEEPTKYLELEHVA